MMLSLDRQLLFELTMCYKRNLSIKIPTPTIQKVEVKDEYRVSYYPPHGPIDDANDIEELTLAFSKLFIN